jgi:hypothetical protein
MEHVMVQFFKNLQIWKFPKTKKIKLSIVTIYHLSSNQIFLLLKYSAWNLLQFY